MRVIISSFFVLILMFSQMTSISFAEENQQELKLANEAKSAILIERDTGTVLFDKNSDEKLPPASMTKIMTMLLIMEAIEEGKLKYDDKIRTSERAASMGGSQIFLEPGEEMTTAELLQAIAIVSANDASVALAEHLAGTEESFVQLMNEKAKQLGLQNTQFKNTTGLPAKEHYSTAKDIAIMSKELLKYEEITKYTGVYESYLRENSDDKFWLVNTNRLVRFYDGVDGLKTGFTSEAKYCLSATAKKEDMRLIAVVFGAPTSKQRNANITEMLNYGFSQYKTHALYKKGHHLQEVPVNKGEKQTVNVVTSESLALLTKKGANIDNVKEHLNINEKITAPLKKGEQIGTIKFEQEGKIVLESPVVTSETIEKASWWQLYKRSLSMFVKFK